MYYDQFCLALIGFSREKLAVCKHKKFHRFLRWIVEIVVTFNIALCRFKASSSIKELNIFGILEYFLGFA